MAKDKSFDEVEFKNFFTIASPHLGVRHLLPEVLKGSFLGLQYLTSYVVNYKLDKTGIQLTMTDSPFDIKKSVLYNLTSDLHLNGLKRFQNPVLFANIIGDTWVGYHSAAVRKKNNFEHITTADILHDTLEIEDVISDNSVEHYMADRLETVKWKRFAVHTGKGTDSHAEIIGSKPGTELLAGPVVDFIISQFVL